VELALASVPSSAGPATSIATSATWRSTEAVRIIGGLPRIGDAGCVAMQTLRSAAFRDYEILQKPPQPSGSAQSARSL